MIVLKKKRVISSPKQQIASVADCWQTTFPFKLSMPEAFVAIGYILEPCYLCQQASEIVQLFRQIYACSDFHSPGFFLESLFFFHVPLILEFYYSRQ